MFTNNNDIISRYSKKIIVNRKSSSEKYNECIISQYDLNKLFDKLEEFERENKMLLNESFDIFNNKEHNSDEYENLKDENEQLKKDVDKLIKDNDVLSLKLDKLTSQNNQQLVIIEDMLNSQLNCSCNRKLTSSK